mmetsp:Transcript_29954/g.84493  ORF Transcript_29954/g.84493 Transcript_29954/m.84493 type:complete len:221 (-) Transcript_29954:1068-1730(-)
MSGAGPLPPSCSPLLRSRRRFQQRMDVLNGHVLDKDKDTAHGVAGHPQVGVQIGDDQVGGMVHLHLRGDSACHSLAGRLEDAIHRAHQCLNLTEVHLLSKNANLVGHREVLKHLWGRDARVNLPFVEPNLHLSWAPDLDTGVCREGEHEGHSHVHLVLHSQVAAVNDLGNVADVDERELPEGPQHGECLRVGGVHQLPPAIEQLHCLRGRWLWVHSLELR